MLEGIVFKFRTGLPWRDLPERFGRSDDGGATQAERLRIRQEALWQARFEGLFESLAEAQRDLAAAELRSLLESHRESAAAATAGENGLAVGGDLNVSADHGSVAAGVINGGVQLSHPTPPAPFQG